MPCSKIDSIHMCVPLLLSTAGGQDVLQNPHSRKHTFCSLTGSVCVGRSSPICLQKWLLCSAVLLYKKRHTLEDKKSDKIKNQISLLGEREQ